MIERLLAGEAALARDELDAAERLFSQIATSDPRNAIAVAGLARIAARKGDLEEARRLAVQALEIDPEEAAATRLLTDLERPATEPTRPAAAKTGWRAWLDRLLRRR